MAKIAFSHSLEYKAGRVAAHIDDCGRYDLNRALYNKYGKSEDYENGKLDILMKNGGGESHEERGLHCDEVEDFAIKLLNASAQAPNINQAESIPFICRMAFNFQTGRWMEPSNGVYWYPYEVQGEFVNRARSQGLSEQDCIRTLKIENLVKGTQARRDREVAHLAELEQRRLQKENKRGGQDQAQYENKLNEIASTKRLAEANKIKNPDAIAVIIGNRDYEGSTPDVDFAGNDADAMKAYVLNKLGYRPGNIIDLRDATQARLRDTFGTKESHRGRLYDYVRADESDVIVFYSGHGVPGLLDKRGYLLSVDSNPNRAEITGYPVDVLLKNLAKVPAKSMLVFIDACFSGDSPKGMLIRATSGLTVKITAPKKASDNMIVITAAEGDQFASWDEDAKHGLFTKHLLEALNGAADRHAKTGNKDGKVTLGEVKAYLDREMTYQARRRFSRDQHVTVSGDLKTVLSAY